MGTFQTRAFHLPAMLTLYPSPSILLKPSMLLPCAALLAGHNPQRIRAALESSMQTAVNEITACKRAGGTSCSMKGRYEAYVTRVLDTLLRPTTAAAANITMTIHASLVPAATEPRPLTPEACDAFAQEVGLHGQPALPSFASDARCR